MQANTTQNNASNPVQGSQPSYGGMDQVCSGPAGMLYSLSNQLIGIYNELQDLYGKVAVAETDVQQSTIQAGAVAQRDAANQQAWATGFQAAEAIVGAGVSIGTMIGEGVVTKGVDDQTAIAEKEIAPLKELELMQKHTPPQNRMIGNQAQQTQDITGRIADLKAGRYEYHGQQNENTINQLAINDPTMTPQDFIDFKQALSKRISEKETNVNTLQQRRNYAQTRAQTFGQLVTGSGNAILKGFEANQGRLAGSAQAQVQVTNGVQGMANSTADSARGSIGQDYAKVSDVIASARQGAQAYAQT